MRKKISQAHRWVIKIGSSLLTNDGKGVNCSVIGDWVEQIAYLKHKLNKEIILVSSGAVAEGMSRLGWNIRPNAIHDLQAAAAVGQMGLIQAYENCFQKHDLHTAQILLTHDDLSNRQRYINARSTIRTLLSLGVIPIVNENDTVVTDEIKFGDNDTLGALVANLIEADLLVILTDQKGLYNKDPRSCPDAELILESPVDNDQLLTMAGGAGILGSGGMKTKITAARIAARSGAATVIMGGREKEGIRQIVNGKDIGTLLIPSQEPLTARKRWLAGQLQINGRIILDKGAVKVLKESGSSLLAVGVKDIEGNFDRGEVVSCRDNTGNEIARGLVNYSSAEVTLIKGHSSQEIESILGYVDGLELIHRDNLALL